MKARFLGLVFCTVAGCGILPERDAEQSGVGEVRGVGVTTDIKVRPQVRPSGLAGSVTPDPDVGGAPVASIGTLGRTIASLGNAAEPGLWLKTPLVQTQRAGRVYYPDTNKSVAVTLIPIEGPASAGSRLSLQAMQSLGAPLTALPEIDVFPAS